jgi:hypothetical protein
MQDLVQGIDLVQDLKYHQISLKELEILEAMQEAPEILQASLQAIKLGLVAKEGEKSFQILHQAHF